MLYVATTADSDFWRFVIGVFSSEEKAIQACERELATDKRACSAMIVAFNLDGQRREIIGWDRGEPASRHVDPLA